MQIIYAAPFILLSLIAFLVSLLVPKLRPYCFRALLAPVAFGFCSIVGTGMLSFALNSVHGNPLFNRPLTDAQSYILVSVFYFPPGLLGAWLAVIVVKRIEHRWLNNEPTRTLAVRAVAAAIVFPPVFVACFGLSN